MTDEERKESERLAYAYADGMRDEAFVIQDYLAGYAAACERQRVELSEIKNALTKLIDRMDFVEGDPAYIGVWHVSQLHVGPYNGPKYKDELDHARNVIAKYEGSRSGYEASK